MDRQLLGAAPAAGYGDIISVCYQHWIGRKAIPEIQDDAGKSFYSNIISHIWSEDIHRHICNTYEI